MTSMFSMFHHLSNGCTYMPWHAVDEVINQCLRNVCHTPSSWAHKSSRLAAGTFLSDCRLMMLQMCSMGDKSRDGKATLAHEVHAGC